MPIFVPWPLVFLTSTTIRGSSLVEYSNRSHKLANQKRSFRFSGCTYTSTSTVYLTHHRFNMEALRSLEVAKYGIALLKLDDFVQSVRTASHRMLGGHGEIVDISELC